MSILSFHNISQAFGAFDVFSNLDGSIPNDGKIGLVGPNGIGKTTLLLILAGLETPTSGSVAVARGKRLGYLRQEAMEAFADSDNTVYSEMLTVFAALREQEDRLRELEERLAVEEHTAALMDEYAHAQEAFEKAGGYEYETRVQQTLKGLGFGPDLWDMPLRLLSGGQKTRALLARLLLEQPDLLILDEPTNHLDIEAVEWLENTLKVWPGALLIVSHDRYFLDKVVNRIWELSRTGIEVYRGNYSAYVQQRQERWDRAQKVYEQERERMAKELEFIRRNIAGQNTDQAMGRLRRLSRQLVAIEEVGLEAVLSKNWSELGVGSVRPMTPDEAHERLNAFRPASRPPRLNLRLKPTLRGGDIVLRTRDLAVGYPTRPLFDAGDIELRRQEVAALIGPNGAGKTTFLKTIMGELPPLRGEIRLGAGLRVGLFTQVHDDLNSETTLLDEVLNRQDMTLGAARSYLAQYLFRQEDVYKQTATLSGGERGRLALALLALEHPNFLLLDEPTNHLDIPAQEVLQEVVEEFEGTVLLVSHDRYLIDRLATQIWDLRDGELSVFRGTYQEFLAARQAQTAQARQAKVNGRPAAQPKVVDQAKQRAEAQSRLEGQIYALEARLEQLGHAVQDAVEAKEFERMRDISAEYDATQAELERLMAEWETLG